MPTTTNNGWTTPADSDPFKDGALAMRTLGNGIDATSGGTWKAWTTFTPSFTGINIGSTGTTNAAYMLMGKTLFVRVVLTFGGTGISVGSSPYLNLPNSHTAKGPSTTPIFIVDTGSQFYTGIGYSNATTVTLYANNATGTYGLVSAVNYNVPMAWNATDQLFMNFAVEVA